MSHRCFFFGLLAVLLSNASVWATTVLHQSFPDLVQKADTIVVGTVSAIEAEWDAARERPYTFVTFIDLDIRKGSARDTLTLRFLGGPDPDGNILKISGVPDFHLGHRLVLFIAGNEHYAVPLVGMWQGMYRVVFDPERNAEVLYTSTMHPLTTLPAKEGGVVYSPLSTPRDTSADPLALDTLLRAIDQEVAHD